MKFKLNVIFMPISVEKLDIVLMPDVSNAARQGTRSESPWIGIIQAKHPSDPQNRNPNVTRGQEAKWAQLNTKYKGQNIWDPSKKYHQYESVGRVTGTSFGKRKTSGLYGGTHTRLDNAVRILLVSSTWVPGLSWTEGSCSSRASIDLGHDIYTGSIARQ